MTLEKISKYLENMFNFSELCGCDVIKTNYKMDWKTVFVFILVNLAVGLSFHTIYTEMVFKGNHYIILKSASVLGTALQGYMKFVNVLKQQHNFRFLHKEIYEMYKTYELKTFSYKKCLSYNLSLVKKLLAALFSMISLTTIAVIGVPMYVLIHLNMRVEILPFKLPFIDIETDFGFNVTFVVHIVAAFFGAFGNCVFYSWLFIYAAYIPMLKNIILKYKFAELNEILETNPKDVEKTKASLNVIFRWHQKYSVFCNTNKRTFFWIIFVQIITEFLAIVSTIICIFLGIWPPAPVFSFNLFALVYAYFALTNLVELENDDITAVIYDCWLYNLTVAEQKMILIMLRDSQKASGISVGDVAPLSINTALQLTKTVYSLSMMLKELLH